MPEPLKNEDMLVKYLDDIHCPFLDKPCIGKQCAKGEELVKRKKNKPPLIRCTAVVYSEIEK